MSNKALNKENYPYLNSIEIDSYKRIATDYHYKESHNDTSLTGLIDIETIDLSLKLLSYYRELQVFNLNRVNNYNLKEYNNLILKINTLENILKGASDE